MHGYGTVDGVALLDTKGHARLGVGSSNSE